MVDYYDIPEYWNDVEERLFVDLIGDDPNIGSDTSLQFLYHEALFDRELSAEDRAVAYHALDDYLLDEYGIDIDEAYDWDDFRDWYDAA